MKSWCQELADSFYEKLLLGVVDISAVAEELKAEWEGQDFQSVNLAASEVARCLMRKERVSCGDRKDGDFKDWNLEAWVAAEKVENEMKELDHLATGSDVCSFRLNTGEQGAGNGRKCSPPVLDVR